ncbi:hypothetical protein GCM10025331_54100 [Actinoplanes utahensis]|nr:hypothetical protein Aut01nite_62870 [Actinoplanes utahensis]
MTVIAEWADPDADGGPDRVVVEAADIGPGTLRVAGQRLALLTAEFLRMPLVDGFRTMVRQYAENRFAELTADRFHQGLLEIYDKIDNDGRVEAVPVMAAAMRVPEETMRACLRVARQRLNS